VTPADQRPTLELVKKVEHLVDVVNALFRRWFTRPCIWAAGAASWSGFGKNQDLLRRQVRMVGTLEEIGAGKTLLWGYLESNQGPLLYQSGAGGAHDLR
jgi:hypothetical protein